MDWGSEAETQDTSSEDHGAGDPDQFDMTPPAQNFPDWESGSAENTWAVMPDEMADRSRAETERVLGDHGDPMGNSDERAKYARYVKYNVKDQTKKEDKGGNLLSKLLFGAAVISGVAPFLGVKVPGIINFGATAYNTEKKLKSGLKAYNKLMKTDYTVDDFYKSVMKKAKLAKELEKKSAGLGGEEFKRLTYADQLKLLQFRDKDEQDGDGDKTTTTEDVRRSPTKEEMMAAAQRAYEMLYGDKRSAEVIPEDRSKQMAYWQSLMAPYMSAEGGRVPGYNTGGLSNLFRLKNK
jgi:hypothetical protein